MAFANTLGERYSETSFLFRSGMKFTRKIPTSRGVSMNPNTYMPEISRAMFIIENVPGSIDAGLQQDPVDRYEYYEHMSRGFTGDIIIRESNISSFAGLPPTIDGRLDLSESTVSNLRGIDKHFKDGCIRERLVLPDTIESHILGVLKIPQLISISFRRFFTNGSPSSIGSYNGEEHFEKLKTATHIVNKHLATGKADILQCQEELIDAGLKAFAQF